MHIFGFDLQAMEFWHWLALGGAFFVLEILSMSFFFLWLGAAAVIVGLLLLAVPDMAWQLQFGLWAALSVADIFAWRVYRSKNPKSSIPTDEPHLNRRGEQYVGRIFTLETPIENGFGKVKVDDSTWKIECTQDLSAGGKVRVVSIDGTILRVEPES